MEGIQKSKEERSRRKR